MLQKSILSKRKWEEHKQKLGRNGAPGPTVATALATSTKIDNQRLILCTYGKKQYSNANAIVA